MHTAFIRRELVAPGYLLLDRKRQHHIFMANASKPNSKKLQPAKLKNF